ncbi:hypothetical protein NRK68_03165 [Streptomyces yangpuensis]|uniref:Uncharacterized protein n=1 Tax=Streptomyces yangpuensis TaxID=1648182 RepID=A0ABY5PQN2_9ACTN|nr:hypothetical protein [Streptomyces yangpuensis]UUY46306.1 hypothetical protein NRK68_03165 [Streptomyces yangpuensis]
MQLRRALPLTLAALVMASGCVTVHPSPVPDAPRAAPGAAPATAGDRGLPPEPTAAARPLVRLPPSEAAEPAAVPDARAPVPASVPAAGPVSGPASAPRRPRAAAREPQRPPRRAKHPRAWKPVEPARPAPRKKARRQSAAPVRSRPAPVRSYDMAPLCRAAEGTVSPAIVALCR